MQSIPFLSINDEKVAVSQKGKVCFLAPEIVEFLSIEEGEGFLNVVYDYAKDISPLPKKEEILVWSKIVGNWDATSAERFVSIKEIVDSIYGNQDKCKLLQFLKFLKICKQLDAFASDSIFLNREGKLKSKQTLYDAADITETLYNIAKQLIPEDTERFIDKDFANICDLPKYGRDDLKKSINDYVNGQKEQEEPFKDTLPALLDYCSVFPVKNGNSIRNNVMVYICELYGNTYKEEFQKPLEGVEADREQSLYRNSFDVLVECTLKYIESKVNGEEDWFANNRQLHLNILNALSNRDRPTSYQTESFLKYAIIPNQNGTLCRVADLNVLAEVETMLQKVKDSLYDIYQKTYLTSLCQKIVDDDYAWMCEFEKLAPKKVCHGINDTLGEDGYANPVVIEIIDLLDQDSESDIWKEWFKPIEDNKANIFLSRLKGVERVSAYKFMKVDANRKAKVLELIDRPDFDTLIQKAEEFIQNEYERNLVFK